MSAARDQLERVALLKKWKLYPDEVDPSAVAAALRATFPVGEFVRRSRLASKAIIDELIRAPRSFREFFLAEMMRTAPEPERKAAWDTALTALVDLDAFTKLRLDERMMQARVLVRNQRVLHAIQTAVVGNGGAGAHELLAADGSAASVDALLPSALAAQREGGYRLRWFEKMLSRGAKTPEMKEMIASLTGRMEQEEAASPALAFARSIGLGVDRMKTSVFFVSPGFLDAVASTSDRAHFQGQVHIDSTVPGWFRVFISAGAGTEERGDTAFGTGERFRDGLGLGRCDASELPAWLARAQRKLGTQWEVHQVSSTLRGKRRSTFVDWLFAPSRK